MEPVVIVRRMNSQEKIIRALPCITTSRSLINSPRIDRQLQPIKTQTRITSNVSTLNETCFIRDIFNTVEEKQKHFLIIQDESYVKKCCYIMGEL